jgi:hypothetical protein
MTYTDKQKNLISTVGIVVMFLILCTAAILIGVSQYAITAKNPIRVTTESNVGKTSGGDYVLGYLLYNNWKRGGR